MKQKTLWAGLIAVSLLTGMVSAGSPAIVLNEIEQVHTQSSVRFLHLKGDFFSMGEQYGTQLKNELQAFFSALTAGQEKCQCQQQGWMESLLSKAWNGYPYRQRELLRGMSRGSGLSISQLMMVDQCLVLSFLQKEGFGCSTLSVTGEYTVDRQGLIGRNFDWLRAFNQIDPPLIVTYFSPVSGAIPFVTIGFPGMVGALTGMNQKGVFLELNNGMQSGGTVWDIERVPNLNRMTEVLMDAEDLPSASVQLAATNPVFASMITMSDGKQTQTLEYAYWALQKRPAVDSGLVAVTNHFTSQGWNMTPTPSSTFSYQRYDSLQKWAKEHKGEVDLALLQQFFSQSIKNGKGEMSEGVSFLSVQDHPDYTTHHQVVARPETKELWVRVPGKSLDWLHIKIEEGETNSKIR